MNFAKLLLLLVTQISLSNAADNDLLGATKVTCINNKDNSGVFIISFKEGKSKEENTFEIDTSRDPHNAESPYSIGNTRRGIDISFWDGEITLKSGRSIFVPFPFPDGELRWHKAGLYADTNKIVINLEEKTLTHIRVKKDPNEPEDNIDNSVNYHNCLIE